MQTNELKTGLYRHYKGAMYQVLSLARHSETEEWHVVYQALYGDRGIWIRPLTMFCENVTKGEKRIPRFEYIGDGPES